MNNENALRCLKKELLKEQDTDGYEYVRLINPTNEEREKIFYEGYQPYTFYMIKNGIVELWIKK